jgi:hypothetical protein
MTTEPQSSPQNSENTQPKRMHVDSDRCDAGNNTTHITPESTPEQKHIFMNGIRAAAANMTPDTHVLAPPVFACGMPQPVRWTLSDEQPKFDSFSDKCEFMNDNFLKVNPGPIPAFPYNSANNRKNRNNIDFNDLMCPRCVVPFYKRVIDMLIMIAMVVGTIFAWILFVERCLAQIPWICHEYTHPIAGANVVQYQKEFATSLHHDERFTCAMRGSALLLCSLAAIIMGIIYRNMYLCKK